MILEVSLVRLVFEGLFIVRIIESQLKGTNLSLALYVNKALVMPWVNALGLLDVLILGKVGMDGALAGAGLLGVTIIGVDGALLLWLGS